MLPGGEDRKTRFVEIPPNAEQSDKLAKVEPHPETTRLTRISPKDDIPD